MQIFVLTRTSLTSALAAVFAVMVSTADSSLASIVLPAPAPFGKFDATFDGTHGSMGGAKSNTGRISKLDQDRLIDSSEPEVMPQLKYLSANVPWGSSSTSGTSTSSVSSGTSGMYFVTLTTAVVVVVKHGMFAAVDEAAILLPVPPCGEIFHPPQIV